MINRKQEDEFDAVLSRAFVLAFQMELTRYEAAGKEYEHIRPPKEFLEEMLRTYEAVKKEKVRRRLMSSHIIRAFARCDSERIFRS